MIPLIFKEQTVSVFPDAKLTLLVYEFLLFDEFSL